MSERRAFGTRPATEVVRWRNSLFVIFALTGLGLSSWISRTPEVRDRLHATTAEMGLLLFGVSIGAIAGLLASSHVITRLGPTRTIAWSYCAASAGLGTAGLFAAFAPSFGAILIGLAVLGAGNSITDVAMNLSGAANERALRRTVMPLYHASFSLGTVAGAGAGSLLILLGVPLWAHIAGVAVLAIVATLLAVRSLQPVEPDSGHSAEHGAGGWRGRLRVWRDSRVLLVGFVVLGMALAEGSANDWLALAMVDGHGVSHSAGAAVFAIFVAAMTVGRVGGVLVLDRFGRVPVLRSSAALAVLGLLLVILVPSVPLAIVGVVLWGLGAALGFPVGMSAAADDPRTATASLSVVTTIGYCAFLVGPPVIGALGQGVGLLHALGAVLVVITVAGFASGAARERVPVAA